MLVAVRKHQIDSYELIKDPKKVNLISWIRTIEIPEEVYNKYTEAIDNFYSALDEVCFYVRCPERTESVGEDYNIYDEEAI